MGTLHIVFDGLPSHESGRFVEVEDESGKSINAGDWKQREDGLWELMLFEDAELSRLRAANEEYQKAWDDVVDTISKFQPDHKGALMEMLSDLGKERDRLRNTHEAMRDELGEVRRKLAQAEADKARMEGALEASTFLRDAVQSWCGFVMESLPKEARHAFRMNVTERLVLYDKAARALSGPSALEAVRTVVTGVFWLIEHMETLRRSDAPHIEFQNFWGTDQMKRIEEAAGELRAAFGLEPKP